MFHQSTEFDRSKRPATFRVSWTATGCVFAVLCVFACGCHDGPLYGLKKVNPYYAMREWKRDRDLGVTDHERREELQKLADQIGDMDTKDQQFWGEHLDRIMNTDPSAEMRRLSVLAASRMKTPVAMQLIEQGLDDESLKVQMEACRSLGKRTEPEAAQMLASTLGTSTELDVKNSAIQALGNHKGSISIESLRLVLDGQDPATVNLAMTSLRDVMGKDYGGDPKEWIAAIDQRSAPDGDDKVRIADQDDKTKSIR